MSPTLATPTGVRPVPLRAHLNSDPSDGLELLLTSKQVASVLGITTKTLRSWEALGIFPEGSRINARVVRWHIDEVESWIEARKRRREAGSGGLTK